MQKKTALGKGLTGEFSRGEIFLTGPDDESVVIDGDQAIDVINFIAKSYGVKVTVTVCERPRGVKWPTTAKS